MLAIAIILNILLTTGLNQFYKRVTRTMKNPAAQTVGLQLIGACASFLLIPIFELRFPTNPLVYVSLFISCVLYALNNRLLANVRKQLEASVIGIIQQSYTVLMTVAGFVLFREEVTWSKVLGIALIVFANILLFYNHKKNKVSKYAWLGVLAYVFNVIAGIIDVNYSGEFNIAFYCGMTFVIPAILLFFGCRLKASDIVKEYKRANKRDYMMTGLCWGIHYIPLLVAYSIGEVSVVAALTSLSVFLNVLVGYFWLGERKMLARKVVAAALAIIGIFVVSII